MIRHQMIQHTFFFLLKKQKTKGMNSLYLSVLQCLWRRALIGDTLQIELEFRSVGF